MGIEWDIVGDQHSGIQGLMRDAQLRTQTLQSFLVNPEGAKHGETVGKPWGYDGHRMVRKMSWLWVKFWKTDEVERGYRINHFRGNQWGYDGDNQQHDSGFVWDFATTKLNRFFLEIATPVSNTPIWRDLDHQTMATWMDIIDRWWLMGDSTDV